MQTVTAMVAMVAMVAMAAMVVTVAVTVVTVVTDTGENELWFHLFQGGFYPITNKMFLKMLENVGYM